MACAHSMARCGVTLLLALAGCEPSGRFETSDGVSTSRASGDTKAQQPATAGNTVRTPSQRLGSLFTAVPADLSPTIEELPLPELPGAYAIWGATGRDDRGKIWLGISVEGDSGSAHLVEYDPVGSRFSNRGDVLAQLRKRHLGRDGELQMKIHSKLVQADDGHLYFASMDETGEAEDGSALPTWGGHLWRLNLQNNRWEELLATKEALIAVAAGGRWVYALGYFNHVLYQFDTETGDVRHVSVGSVGGHITRNFLVDARGHAYVPRVEQIPGSSELRTLLVELDSQLRRVSESPLEHYQATSDVDSHGIIAFTWLSDGRGVFSTHSGHLYEIAPPDSESAARVSPLGWFHPDGEAYASSLFTFDGQTLLMGQAAKPGGRKDWVVYDLGARTSRVLTGYPGESLLASESLKLYGTHTRDDAGACYLVGRIREAGRGRPIVIKVSFGR